MEKREEYTETTTVGKYTSVITKMRVAGIEIDNYALRKIYENGKLIETIDERRKLPVRIKPPRMRLPRGDITEEKVLLIDHKDPFWTLNKKVNRDITCWLVQNEGTIFLVDVVSGELAGHGSLMPSDKAIAFSGYAGVEDPDDFGDLRDTAASWFVKWGYNTWSIFAPSKTAHGTYISDNACKYRFAVAHGTSTQFRTGENEVITVSDVEGWMSGRDKMIFSFLGHCNGMQETGAGTLSYAFRKGSMQDTVTIGFSGMDTDPECWRYIRWWTNTFFEKANTGVTWKDAFDYALALVYECKGAIKFVGDESLKAVDSSYKLHLSIEDIWIENCNVHYRIKNIGDSVGVAQMQLKINGVSKKIEAESALASGQSREGSFNYTWVYSGGRDAIQVIPDYDADALGTLTKYFKCGDVNEDGKVRASDANRIDDYLLGLRSINMWAADVTGDGRVRTSDANRIDLFLLGIRSLNCTCSEE